MRVVNWRTDVIDILLSLLLKTTSCDSCSWETELSERDCRNGREVRVIRSSGKGTFALYEKERKLVRRVMDSDAFVDNSTESSKPHSRAQPLVLQVVEELRKLVQIQRLYRLRELSKRVYLILLHQCEDAEANSWCRSRSTCRR
jgi:hypothetical protein